MNYRIIEILIGTLVIFAVAFTIDNFTESTYEYEIELINQDSVKIHSIDGDRTYYTTPDSIEYYIEIDNL